MIDLASSLISWAFLAVWFTFCIADYRRFTRVRGTECWHRANATRSWVRPLVKPIFYVMVAFDVARLVLAPTDLTLMFPVAVDAFLWWFISKAPLDKDDDDTDPWGGIKTRLTTPISTPTMAGAAA